MSNSNISLANKYRPPRLEDMLGQEPIVSAIRGKLKAGKLPRTSMYCGAHGSGKTTLARLVAKYHDCRFVELSAVNSGVKDIKDTPLKTFPENEWINLIITITGAENKISLYFLVNGETQLSPSKYPTTSITYKDNIGSIELFNNFFGEVSSIIMLNQNKDFESALFHYHENVQVKK